MRLAPPTVRRPLESVVPLINVVFLLLIFFLLAATLRAPLPFRIVPPVSAGGAAEPEGAAVVALAADGRLALDGEALGRAALAARIARRGAGPVVLAADAAARAGEVLDVVAVLHDAGAGPVRLRVTRGRR